MDLACWLRSLGLEEYESAFRENAIDSEVLPALTADDLKDLGIVKVGHRRKLLEAITALRANNSNKNLQASSYGSQPIEKALGVTGERRHITVMFCDLAGSTAITAKMDPEDSREMLSAYHKCVTYTVHRLGGYVAQYMGDGVLAYFGFPQAHEDDAERAVRTGLELVSAVNALQSRAPLQIRVGIASGLVVVGDLVCYGDAQECGIVGETPNLAARLQAIAGPNMVVIADSTRKLLGNLFELDGQGFKNLKGFSAPVRVWTALRPRPVESRFEALHGTCLTGLIGREEELELLLRRWSKAKSGEGQVVLLSGEPGIGKSRLTVALLESLARESHTRLRYFCSPQHIDSALYPIICQMERAAGLAFGDHPKERLDKLNTLLAQTSTSIQDAALFAEMLSLQNDGRYPTLELLPEQRRQRTLDALLRQAECLTRLKPVLMIFEDTHWIDPTSVEALGRVVDRAAALRALLIVTFRPEFDPPWIGLPHVTALTLSRLGAREVNILIESVAGDHELPMRLRQDIAERTDGIPLFVEEMTKAVLEAESESETQFCAKVPAPAIMFPPSLHSSLLARLDRLGPAKEVAQIGAAIGREFHHALLAAVAGMPDAELDSALRRLIAAGLLFQQGMPPHANYLFKHALVRDAAYSTLLREPKRKLHARIAGTLESHFKDVAENQPELLARHCIEAGLIEKAVWLWGKAGQRSLERSALIEAAAQFSRALDQIATLPSTPALRSEQIMLQVTYANTLIHVKGYAAPETKLATERAQLLIKRAEALGEPPDNPILLFSVLYGIWTTSYVAFNGNVMLSRARQFLALAEKHEATAPLVMAHRIMGISLLTTGDMAQGRAHFDQAISLYDPVSHRPLATRFGVDADVSIFSYRAHAIWSLGFPEAALRDAKEAVRLARETGLATSLMYALSHAAIPYMLCGYHAEAAEQTRELLALAEDKGGLPHWKGLGMMNQGWLLALSGNASGGVSEISSGIALWRSIEATHWMPLRLSSLAAAHADLGHIEEAQRCTDEAIAVTEASNERWCEAEVQRAAGEIALKAPKWGAARAEAHFEHALSVARAQQAKSWELRAAISLARLWRDQGKRQEARDLLAPVYAWFTEGLGTIDLKAAKSLLEEMA